MSVQVINDSQGKPAGVFIPISEWEEIKTRLGEQEDGESADFDIPAWHKPILDERLKDYYDNPEEGVEFDQVMREIDEELKL